MGKFKSYPNLSEFCLTLFAMTYTIPYSKRAFFGLSESVIHVNGTQIFANLDFREVLIQHIFLAHCEM